MTGTRVRLWEMAWPEVRDFLAGGPRMLLLPVGSMEQHGPHLPILMDSIAVQWVAERTAERLGTALVAPTICYGVSDNHLEFPGTASVTPDTLKRVVVDVGATLLEHGFSTLVLLNGHGGNMAALGVAAHELRAATRKTVIVVTWPFVVKRAFKELECEVVWHADEGETSVMLHIAPDAVRMDRAVRELPRPVPGFVFTEEALAANLLDRGLPRTRDVSDSGTIGDATLATKAKGERILSEAVANLVQALQVVTS